MVGRSIYMFIILCKAHNDTSMNVICLLCIYEVGLIKLSVDVPIQNSSPNCEESIKHVGNE